MKRRDLLALLPAPVVARAAGAEAQPAERRRRVGVAMSTAEHERHEQAALKAFVAEMVRLGWQPGRNVDITYRWGAGDAARMQAIAQELVTLAPDAILAKGGAMPALRDATATIPIVFVFAADDAALKYAGEFTRPQHNMTGFTTPENELVGKRLQLLREVAPAISRVLYIWNRDVGGPSSAAVFARIAADAKMAGIDVVDGEAETASAAERAIEAFAHQANGGLIVAFNAFTTTHRQVILDAARRHRLPAVYPLDFFAEDGGLLAYGFDQEEIFRQGAGYIDRLLRGATPAELPVQFPTRFKLVVNRRTAAALGLNLSPLLLARADEVIE